VANLPDVSFGIPVTQNMIMFSGTLQSGIAIPTGQSLKLNVYRNNVVTDLSMTIAAGQTLASNIRQSVDFTRGEFLTIVLVSSGGNLNTNVAASFAFY
jgi:hypothetical protein